MNFNNKVVVITGASSGIGLALSQEFSAKGAKVVMGARSEDKLQEIAKELPNESLFVKTDVTQENECKALIAKTIERFGKIDVLICNAGLSMRALYDDVDMSVIHKLMDVNFWGTAYCIKYALP